MKTYLVSIMGKKGIFKKEVKAGHYEHRVGFLWFYESRMLSAFLVVKEWILVEEVTE